MWPNLCFNLQCVEKAQINCYLFFKKGIKMFKKIKSLAALSVVAVAFIATPSSATVVDFTGLTNFSNYTENGMVMTSNSVWNWPGADMAHMDSGVAIFKLVSNNDFNLTSIDMINDGGNGPAKFSAYNNGVLLGFNNVNGNQGTYSFGSLFSSIDEFRVSLINNHFTFDNINFTAANTVPEPSTLALLGLSLAGLALARKRKSA